MAKPSDPLPETADPTDVERFDERHQLPTDESAIRLDWLNSFTSGWNKEVISLFAMEFRENIEKGKYRNLYLTPNMTVKLLATTIWTKLHRIQKCHMLKRKLELAANPNAVEQQIEQEEQEMKHNRANSRHYNVSRHHNDIIHS